MKEPLFSVDRPDTSESAFTVPHGFVQAELGLRANWQGGGSRAYFVDNLFRFGIRPAWELRLGGGFPAYQDSADRRAAGTAPLYAGLKRNLAEERGDSPSVGWLVNANLPSPTSGFSSGRVDGSFLFLANKTLGLAEFEVNLGPGLLYDAEAAAYVGQAVYAATLSYYPRPSLRYYVELFGGSPGAAGRRSAVHSGAGIHWYDFRRFIAIDLGFTTGLSRLALAGNRLTVFVGFSFMR